MAYSNFGAQFQAFVIRVANSIKELSSNITTLNTNVVKTVNNNKPTNGNITPAQTGCLPLGGGNVTGNLTVQSKNVVRSVNGTSADANGNVNVDVTLTKDKVTSALGYTPLKTAPVTSVDGKTGAVSLSNVYQPKGNYLTSAPVTSVNGQTGAVTINVVGTKVNNAAWADGAWSATVTPNIGFVTSARVPAGGTWACFGSYTSGTGDDTRPAYVNGNYAGGYYFGPGSSYKIICIRIA